MLQDDDYANMMSVLCINARHKNNINQNDVPSEQRYNLIDVCSTLPYS